MIKHFVFAIAIFTTLSSSNVVSEAASGKAINLVSINGLIEQEVGRLIVPKIYKKAGLNVTITPMFGDLAAKSVEAGIYDGEIMRIHSYGKEHTETIRVPTPYYFLETMAFFLKGKNINVKNKEDLANYKIAVVRGVKHTKLITAGLENVVKANSTRDMVLMLLNGEVDLILTNSVDGKMTIKKMGIKNISSLAKPLAKMDLYLYIHKSKRDLLQSLDQSIVTLINSGEMDKLIQNAERLVIENLSRAQ